MIVWLVPERRGGIRAYADHLFPYLELPQGELVVIQAKQHSRLDKEISQIAPLKPTLIHIQHEFGLFGSKNAPFYTFPRFVRKLRARFPHAKIVATAHTVISPDFSYPVKGRGWQAPLRWLANRVALGQLQKIWNEDTWGALDGVIVHSKWQEKIVAKTGVKHPATIFHFVYDHTAPRKHDDPELLKPVRAKVPGKTAQKNALSPYEEDRKTIMVFGFFSPDKGQDIAISALTHLPDHVHLLLAGGARRTQDYRYLEHCLNMARRLGVDHRVAVTGFVSEQHIDDLYARADLVVAPFRETSGSGSLAQALSRGAPILAADLRLNREIEERQQGAVAFFKAKDPSDLATQAMALLRNREKSRDLRENALKYAALCHPSRIARLHLEFYEKVMG